MLHGIKTTEDLALEFSKMKNALNRLDGALRVPMDIENSQIDSTYDVLSFHLNYSGNCSKLF